MFRLVMLPAMKALLLTSSLLMASLIGSAKASYIYFKADDAPAEGVDRVVYHMTVLDSPMINGYYWADQANFVHGGHAMYIGLQPRPELANFRAVYSVFGKGARGLMKSTHDGADGGAGASGWIAYPWQQNRRYSLEMKRITSSDAHDDEQAWEGTVTDEVTKQSTVIARYAVPKEWGGLSPRSVFFSEYFIYNNPKYRGEEGHKLRPEQAYCKVQADAPEVWADGKQLTAKVSGTKANDAKNETLTKISDTAAVTECGLTGKGKALADLKPPATQP